VSVCHNDALAGDIYVNHGILRAAMKARGQAVARMVRNPLHLFTSARDAFRYSARGPHRVVVNLSASDDRTLHEWHRHLGAETVVIGNGVDVDRYQPATPRERSEAKRALDLDPDLPVALFIGHEFERKGLPLLVGAVGLLADPVQLVVVGGSPQMIERAQRSDSVAALGDRVHFVGSQPDARPWLRAADVFALPSAYEASPLVVLEALASGVPVVASAVGSIPDVIVSGTNGMLVALEAREVAAGLDRILSGDCAALAREARLTAERHSWEAVGRRYLDVIERLRAARLRDGERSTVGGQ
jgi:glycosyltransferase involved in cell wall biosynthesis